ncbi:beta-lactamase/transpeptidase-like protein [Hyaloraphidium curvatum]|nr:beta-lactamase/transpeptidase-like protein [Hyaloraphidium curvatum]
MAHQKVALSGHCDPAFERVRAAFEASFEEGTNLGASLCVFYKNRKVVDLAGGFTDTAKTKQYTTDTVVHSSGKFAMGLATLQAVSQGLFSLDDRIADIWPEFAAGGKEAVTVRDLLEHMGGVGWVDPENAPTWEEWQAGLDLDKLAQRIAKQPHNWGGQLIKAYHAQTRGWYLNELLRRRWPDSKMSLGELARKEWNPKLGIALHCGVPDEVLSGPDFCDIVISPEFAPQIAGMASLPPDLPMAKMNVAVMNIKDADPAKGQMFSHSRTYLKGETPSASCVSNARTLATLANALTASNKGTVDGYRFLSPEIWEQGLQREPRNANLPDAVIGAMVPTAVGGWAWNLPERREMQQLMDWSKVPPQPVVKDWQLGEGWEWIGWGGFGGSLVQCAPYREVAFGFVPNWLLPGLLGDERGSKLMAAVADCVDAIEGR